MHNSASSRNYKYDDRFVYLDLFKKSGFTFEQLNFEYSGQKKVYDPGETRELYSWFLVSNFTLDNKYPN